MRKAVDHLKQADPVMAGIIERVGAYRPRHMEPSFHGLARSIVFQQVSGFAGAAIFARLAAAASDPLTPDAVTRLTLDELRAVGLSRQKAAYIRDLAERTASGEIVFADLADLPDEDIIRRLTVVKGIGTWTVQMYLIFALQRPDVFPAGDLGIRNAIQRAYRMRKPPTPDRMIKLAKKWSPWRTVASWYLWRSLETPTP